MGFWCGSGRPLVWFSGWVWQASDKVLVWFWHGSGEVLVRGWWDSGEVLLGLLGFWGGSGEVLVKCALGRPLQALRAGDLVGFW